MNNTNSDGASAYKDSGSTPEEIPFNKQLRKATREIHAISDALVNAKLAFALSDNAVWAEGLLIFYEIFRFLEGAMVRLKHSYLANFSIDGIHRTEAFEKDLEFYLGSDWNKNYIPRESVTKYLIHLQKLEENDPLRLVAYVYHLYMGLLSGGQILRRQRLLTSKLVFSSNKDGADKGGNAVTEFGETPIFELKREIIAVVNSIADTLNDNEKQSLLEESKIVFDLNNSIIRSVKGANQVVLKKLIIYLATLFIVSYSIYYFFF